MRFTGERHLAAPIDQLWAALHTGAVLRAAIPGCERLTDRGAGEYAAVLGARVGPVADTYRGRFTITDLQPGTSLRVGVEARGRCGRLELDLHVALVAGNGGTTLRYDADAVVSGLVARLGTPTLVLAGTHLTGCFFRELGRSLTPARQVVPA